MSLPRVRLETQPRNIPNSKIDVCSSFYLLHYSERHSGLLALDNRQKDLRLGENTHLQDICGCAAILGVGDDLIGA